MDTSNLTDALYGGDLSDSSIFTTTPPLAPPGGASPNVPAAQNTDIGTAPDIGAQPAAAPIQTNTPGPAKPAGTPSVWKDIVMGALTGLAGSAGSTHFGGGAAAGAGAVLQQKQRDIENLQRQKQIEFESARAADTHIAALDEHRRADRLNEEAKLGYAQKSAEYQAFLQDNFGIEPNLSFNDQTHEATGAMNTLAQMNGGQYPPVSAVHQPSPDGEHGKIAVFSPSQQQMRQNANGFRDLINTQRAVQGQPPIDDATFNSLGFKGQRDNAQKAIDFLKPTPGFSMDKNKPDYLPAVLAQRQQQLAQYQAHKDENGKPDANPNIEKQLQASIDYLQSSWDSVNKSENKAAADSINATAGPKANAAAQEEIAKNTGAAGQSAVDLAAKKKTAETNAAAQSAGVEWKPKVSADEKKKAELAENIAFNANEVNSIIARRPDLVGAIAGRYTSAQQMIGNNDPDISAIGTHVHNLAMANSGVHGFRSQEGVVSYEKQLLNNFKNGPQAIAGALSASTGSVQTFIDNARPEGYGTHSKQGGAVAYYGKQNPSAPAASRPAGATHTGKGSDGNSYYLGANGQVLGRVQ